MVRLLRGLTLALCLAGCAAGGAGLSPIKEARLDRYRLDTGDQVRVTAYEFDALSQTYTVNDSGAISVPLLGPVLTRGRTTEELERSIEAELSKGLQKNPSVSAQIERFRPFFILGEVKEPGQYPYVPGITVLSAVATAGGYTYRAQTGQVSITRPSETGAAMEGRAATTTPVLPGDTIYVFERWF
jgi:polysaccharide export outer membrane protein